MSRLTAGGRLCAGNEGQYVCWIYSHAAIILEVPDLAKRKALLKELESK
jgi:hypothetical protein